MSQQINLYNPLLLRQHKLFSLKTMAQALGLILAGTVLFYAYARYNAATVEKQAAETSRMHASTLARLESLKTEAPGRQLQEEVARMESQLAARRRVIALVESGEFGNKQGFSEYFRALSRQTPDGLWLTGFRVAGSGEVAISGRALDPGLVPIFIGQMKREKALAGKTFATLEMRLPEPPAQDGKPPAQPRYVEFSLLNAEAEAPR